MRLPIGPYVRMPAELLPWDPAAGTVARIVADLVRARRPELVVEHIGSTAVPGLPGKGIVDLAIATEPAAIPGIVADLFALGFGPQPGPDPWPATRPMLVGSLEVEGRSYRIHLHVQPGTEELRRDLAFRDALRSDPALLGRYRDLKAGIVEGGLVEGHQYTYQKQAWIAETQRSLGMERPPIAPPATIGILGGGQLGRMLGLAARAMGYRVVVLDPDGSCPAAAVADRVVVAGYDDVGGASRLAALADVVTYELEHVAVEVIDAIDATVPVRPGRVPLLVTQDRLTERRFVESVGAPVAPWRAVSTEAELAAAVDVLGLPLRLKVATGGYDGRGQVRIAGPQDLPGAMERLGRRRADAPVLAEAEVRFEAELSVVIARGVDGRTVSFPVSRNVHDAGILAESTAPAGIPEETAVRAGALGERLAVAMGLVGTLTAELFLLPDGELVVNELAPRVHNSGHWTLEGAATSQFEQHIRAICGLRLGSPASLAPSAMVNLWGAGPLRPAALDPVSVGRALSDAAVHLHLYDKRRVFERRKMGHLTALGATTEDALQRARSARDALRWRDEEEQA